MIHVVTYTKTTFQEENLEDSVPNTSTSTQKLRYLAHNKALESIKANLTHLFTLPCTSNHRYGQRAGFFENEHLPVVFRTLCFRNEIIKKSEKVFAGYGIFAKFLESFSKEFRLEKQLVSAIHFQNQ